VLEAWRAGAAPAGVGPRLKALPDRVLDVMLRVTKRLGGARAALRKFPHGKLRLPHERRQLTSASA
jgi:hypothetical protein